MINLGKLREGDTIRNEYSGEVYVVVQTDPHIVAVRAVTVDNAPEWALVSMSNYLPRAVEVVRERGGRQWLTASVTAPAPVPRATVICVETVIIPGAAIAARVTKRASIRGCRR